MKEDIIVTSPNNAKINKRVAFKNNAPFISCISKSSSIKVDNAEDLDVVMPIYKLLEYKKNYKKTTGSLWNYYRDQPSDPLSTYSESFKYKTSITWNTYNVDEKLQIMMVMKLIILNMTQIELVKMKQKLLFH